MDARVIKALACESRLKILDFLNWPELYFADVPNARQTGLTNKLICGRLGITQESVSLHMRWLTEARLVSATKVGTRVFYKRNEPGIDEAITALCELLQGCNATRRYDDLKRVRSDCLNSRESSN